MPTAAAGSLVGGVSLRHYFVTVTDFLVLLNSDSCSLRSLAPSAGDPLFLEELILALDHFRLIKF